MASDSLRDRLQSDMKTAMREGQKDRLGVIRFLMAAVKQKEVDDKQKYADSGLPDDEIMAVIEKLCKQRRDSIESYQQANRDDLVATETFELEVLQEYLPPQLSDDELTDIIKSTISETGASEMKDMGNVMAALKPKIQGRADMKAVSAKIKSQLGA